MRRIRNGSVAVRPMTTVVRRVWNGDQRRRIEVRSVHRMRTTKMYKGLAIVSCRLVDGGNPRAKWGPMRRAAKEPSRTRGIAVCMPQALTPCKNRQSCDRCGKMDPSRS